MNSSPLDQQISDSSMSDNEDTEVQSLYTDPDLEYSDIDRNEDSSEFSNCFDINNEDIHNQQANLRNAPQSEKDTDLSRNSSQGSFNNNKEETNIDSQKHNEDETEETLILPRKALTVKKCENNSDRKEIRKNVKSSIKSMGKIDNKKEKNYSPLLNSCDGPKNKKKKKTNTTPKKFS